MDDFQRYLDMFSPGDATLRAALDGRLAPNAHYERFFNVPFPRMYTGLSGLGVVGQPLPQPSLEIVPFTAGVMMASPVWTQRALNTLLPAAQRVVVDGVVGPQTLNAVRGLWRTWATTPGAAALRALAVRQDPHSQPVEPTIGPWASGIQTLRLERAFMYLLAGSNAEGRITPRIQVADPAGSTCPDDATGPQACRSGGGPVVIPGSVVLDPDPPSPPSTSTGTGALALVAVAALLGFWYSR